MKPKKHHVYAAVLVLGTAIGGFAYNNAQAPRAAEENKVPAAVYLDVRTDTEWEAGHLNDAVHLDLQEIQNGRLPDLPKDAEIKIYCRSGKRAETAKGILERNGFMKVENAGGYENLASDGRMTCAGALARCK